MSMKRPPHPGRSIKSACLDAVGLNVTEAAKVLDVARHTLSRVLNGPSGISPEMAIRLQAAYDLALAREHEDEIQVKRYVLAQPYAR